MVLDLEYMAGLVPVILRYVPLTLGMAVMAMAIALVLAAVLAVIRVLKVPVLDRIVAVFISFFRGTPLLVQLFLFYYGLPQVVAAFRSIDGVTAAVIGLTLHFSAYMAESIRGAILGIDRSQWEAGAAVGMTQLQLMRRIILPQAARVAAPTLLNYFIDMIKSTSLAFTLGVTEMMGAAQKEAAGSFRYLEAFLVVALSTGRSSRRCPSCSGGWKSASAGRSPDDPRRGARQAVRRADGARRHRPRDRARRADRRHRPVGHRQVDAAPLPQLPRPARGRPHHPGRPHRRRRARLAAGNPGAPAADRLRVPELRALRQQDRAAEHHRGADSGEALPQAEAEARADAILAEIGLADRGDTYPAALSGGQQQRVGIGRAMALEAELMLVDEPTSALDPEWVGEVLDLLRRVASSTRPC